MNRMTFAAAAAALALSLLGIGPALASDSDFSTQETRALMHAYAKCVVKSHGKKASDAILTNADNSTIVRRYAMLIVGSCLPRQAAGNLEMRFSGDLYRYALADALVNKELAASAPPNLSGVPVLGHREAGTEPAQATVAGKKLSKKKYEAALEDHRESVALSFLSRYGECVVRTDAAGSKALLLVVPDSPDEIVRLRALRPALETCMPESQTVKFGRVTLRGLIAINYYRLSAAARAAALRVAG